MILPAQIMFKRARASCRALLFCIAAAILAAAIPGPAQAGRGNQHRQEHAEGAARQQGRSDADGAARAAAIAASRYEGGKVLKVSPQGDVYSVRVLLPDGTVKNITVEAGD